MMRRLPLLALLLVSFSTIVADDDLAVFNENSEPNKMLTRFVYEQTEPLFEKRAKKFEQLIADTHTNRMLWRQLLKSQFIERLGGFPERTPLNPQLVGKLQGDGYTIEKLIYESRPGFFVTANLYLPETKPPYPGILFPCGHTENGKAGGSYQRTCQLLARNGMAVLCYDPIGQGERKQILVTTENGVRLPTGEFKSTSEHTITGVAPILLGESLATYRIWDGMRGLDYLESRNDIDPKRLGCTGNSGGGLMTSYLVALDDRIKAAAPGCFITTTKRKNVSPGPGDAEQNIFGQIADGLDHSDYLMLGAPCATLICSASKDFVPIEGAWEAFREVKRFYTAEGIPERIDLIEVNEQHGYTKPLRLAATNWMSRWLLDKNVSVQENELPLHSDEELQCTPRGQVLLLPGAKSMTDLCVEKSNQLAEQRAEWKKQQSPDELRKKIDELLGTRSLESRISPKTDHLRTLTRKGYKIEQLSITPKDGMTLPVLMFVPDKTDASLMLYLHGDGISIDSPEINDIEKLIKAGTIVFAVTLRGDGDTETKAWRFSATHAGPNAAEYFIAYMSGRSLVGMRTADILNACTAFISEQPTNPQELKFEDITVIAIGDTGIPVMHAAALNPELFSHITIRDSISTWQSVIETPVTIRQLENTVHGALKFYDLPDLIELAGPDKVTIESPRDAMGKPIPVKDEKQ